MALIGVPYYMGQPDVFLGRGPRVLFSDENLPSALRDRGIDFDVRWVEAAPGPEDLLLPGDPMGHIMIENRRLAELVAEARAEDRVPIVACGGCSPAVGVVSGISDPALAVVWIDAHADSDTPDTSPSGCIEGMAAAVVAGRCWNGWAAQIPGFLAIDESRWAMVGCHTYQPEEESVILGDNLEPIGEHVGRAVIDASGGMADALTPVLERLVKRGAERVYLHVDVDSLEVAEGRAHGYTVPGGLSVAELTEAIETTIARLPLAAVSFTAYDPDEDPRMEGIVTALATAAAQRLQAANAPG